MTAAADVEPAAAARVPFDRIDLRHKERGFIVGGSDSGKSTLADLLGAMFVQRYAARGGRRLILDSKPRYRAQWDAKGRPARRRYRKWDHGEAIPNSVVVDSPDDLRLAWETGARTVIVQTDRRVEIPRLVATASRFLDDSRAGRPQLLQVDETLDFFHMNGSPRGGDDTLERAARAGRERGTACLFCSQRTKQMPTAILTELSRLYVLRLDYKADVKRLAEAGAPLFPVPREPHIFRYWWKGDYSRIWGPYRLDLSR